MILPVLLVAGIIFTTPKQASATYPLPSFNPCQYVPQLCSQAPTPTPSPSVAPSESPSASPSVEPSSSPCVEVEVVSKDLEINPCPSVEPSASPSASPAQGNPGLTNPGPGGTSGSDGKPTYDPNDPARGGVAPVVPKAAPATGFGPK